MEHCGGCGRACALPNGATPACAAGVCAIAACAPGAADCDGAAANGCEVDTRTSAAHCGRCGARCAFDHAAARCEGGACAMRACEAPWADCNGLPGDGCEVNLQTNRAHCGGCGLRCSLPGAASVSCPDGVCRVGECAANRGNCNGSPADGCEAALPSTVDHCGACGRACALPNATARCAAGACQVEACARGFADCDGAPLNGCEADLRTSGRHCSTCGNACGAGTTCEGSFCRCVTPRGASGTSTRSVRAGGESRSFLTIVSPFYDRARATPVTFVFHGFNMSAGEMADDARVHGAGGAPSIVVYPTGLYRAWNAGLCCPLATTQSVNDLAFFDEMLRDLSANFCVDARRVYVAGYSNGGMMAQRIACERATAVAAVASVSGPYDRACRAARPVPALYIHAVDDRIIPYDGGTFSGLVGVALPSASETLKLWRGVDRCGAVLRPYFSVGDTTCARFDGCAEEVAHCRVGSGGHRWPRPPPRFLATPEVLGFFRRHARP